MRILFFSDWRIQPFHMIENTLNQHGPFDLIIYGGDDVNRFVPVINIPQNVIDSAHGRCEYIDTSLMHIANPEEITSYIAETIGHQPYCTPLDNGHWTMNRILGLFRSPVEKNWLSHIASKTQYGVFSVLGNDSYPEHRLIFNAPGVQDIHTTPGKIGDWSFIGIEGSIFSLQEGQIVNKKGYTLFPDDKVIPHINEALDKTQGSTENLVIVSHTPPAGCLDTGIRFGFERIGSPALADYILKKQPALVLCGHSHSSGGRSEHIERTLVVNAASNDRDAKRANIVIIELENEKPVKLEWANNIFSSNGSNSTNYSKNSINSILYIPYIAEKRAAKLEKVGIRTPDQLFEASDELIQKVLNYGPRHLARIRAFQRAIASNWIEWLPGPPIKIPDNLIIYDVETGINTHPDPWMIAALVHQSGHLKQWTVLKRNKKPRKKMYQEFIELLKQYPGASMCAWNSGGFDYKSVYSGLVQYYPEGLEFWDNLNHFNIFKTVNSRLVFPLPDRSIKTIATWCGFKIEGAVSGMDGFQVGMLYETYLKYGQKFNVEIVEKYNRYDLYMLQFFVNWLKQLDEPDTVKNPPKKKKKKYLEPVTEKARARKESALILREKGHSYKEIAQILQISYWTVKDYLRKTVLE